MRAPFPGMDPWLEHPGLWPDVHNALITAIRAAITPQLPSAYFVALEERTVFSVAWEDDDHRRPDLTAATFETHKPDRANIDTVPASSTAVLQVEVPFEDEIRETYLEIRDSAGEGRLITAIEVLSPTNKRAGDPRRKYEHKRSRITHSRSSLVEIDLLRGGKPMPVVQMGAARAAIYRILVSRGWERPNAQLYTFGIRTPIPVIPIPLTPGESEPELDLKPLLHDLYGVARYHLRVDYKRPPLPPLSESDAEWAKSILGT